MLKNTLLTWCLLPCLTQAQIAESDSLFIELKALDSLMFHAAFEGEDLSALEGLFSEDFEFYHDRDGLILRDQFLKTIPINWQIWKDNRLKIRRVLVPGSLQVYPLADYGAIQMGVHRFYITEGDAPERPGDEAKYTHIWEYKNGKWKIKRELSYDHRLMEE